MGIMLSLVDVKVNLCFILLFKKTSMKFFKEIINNWKY